MRAGVEVPHLAGPAGRSVALEQDHDGMGSVGENGESGSDEMVDDDEREQVGVYRGRGVRGPNGQFYREADVITHADGTKSVR